LAMWLHFVSLLVTNTYCSKRSYSTVQARFSAILFPINLSIIHSHSLRPPFQRTPHSQLPLHPFPSRPNFFSDPTTTCPSLTPPKYSATGKSSYFKMRTGHRWVFDSSAPIWR
jgi:hypothetical protein